MVPWVQMDPWGLADLHLWAHLDLQTLVHLTHMVLLCIRVIQECMGHPMVLHTGPHMDLQWDLWVHMDLPSWTEWIQGESHLIPVISNN